MGIDQNDQNPTNNIIKLSKAFDNVYTCKSDPDRPFPSHCTYTVYNTLPSLNRNEFNDDACSNSLSNRCGWLLDCSSSRGYHVVALYIFFGQMMIPINLMLAKLLRWSFICLTDILVI